MYCAGNYCDSVTRYNHKDVNRWMTPGRQAGPMNWCEIASWSVISICMTVALAIVMMLIKAA